MYRTLVSMVQQSRGSLGTHPARITPAIRNSAVPQQSVPGESRSPSVAEIGLQAHSRDKHQPLIAGPTNTPERTRWQKANLGMLLTEIQATWHHLNPILPQQQVLDSPTYQKSKISI